MTILPVFPHSFVDGTHQRPEKPRSLIFYVAYIRIYTVTLNLNQRIQLYNFRSFQYLSVNMYNSVYIEKSAGNKQIGQLTGHVQK